MDDKAENVWRFTCPQVSASSDFHFLEIILIMFALFRTGQTTNSTTWKLGIAVQYARRLNIRPPRQQPSNCLNNFYCPPIDGYASSYARIIIRKARFRHGETENGQHSIISLAGLRVAESLSGRGRRDGGSELELF